MSADGHTQIQCEKLFQNFMTISKSSLVAQNNFETSRKLNDYTQMLHSDFKKSLDILTHKNHWIDLGAGKVNAQIDYLKSRQYSENSARLTAIVYKFDRWFLMPKLRKKINIIEGAFENHNISSWQKADLVTDVFGVISYTLDLSETLQKVFELLNTNGELYIHAKSYYTKIETPNGLMNLADFLFSLKGLKVEGAFGILKITKLEPNINVPYLKLKNYLPDSPYVRTFELIED